jgi:hypothetical protein
MREDENRQFQRVVGLPDEVVQIAQVTYPAVRIGEMPL